MGSGDRRAWTSAAPGGGAADDLPSIIYSPEGGLYKNEQNVF